MKASVKVMDWDGDGHDDLLAEGFLWRKEGDHNGSPVYTNAGKARFAGPAPVDLNGDGALNTVLLKGDRFTLYVRGTDSKYTPSGNLPFTTGTDLRLPDAQKNAVWNLHALADLDNDGLVDLLVSEYTFEQLDGDHAYVPRTLAGHGIGWDDGRWIFQDVFHTLWWHRNTGTATDPSFAMGQLVRYGDVGLSICSDVRSFSATALDWNGDGRKDIFTHSGNRSAVFLGKDPAEVGGVLFDNGHVLTYGGRNETDHRKTVEVMRDSDGLLHLFQFGGDVVYESVQLAPDDAFAFSDLRMVLFRNPPTMELDIFAVPDVADWNGDGRKDFVVGSECGYLWYFENKDPSGGVKAWSPPQLLAADGKPIRLFKEYNLQGPEEWLIGYSNPTVEDWDLDGDLDLLCGHHGETFCWFENIGTRTAPKLTARGNIKYEQDGRSLWVNPAWRQRPGVGDLTGDGLPDLVASDGDQMLTVWRRFRAADGSLKLGPPEYPIDTERYPFVLSSPDRGVGRAKNCVVDWDRDGRMDLITSPPSSVGARTDYVYYYRSLGEKDGRLVFDFQPRAIKISGHVEPGQFTHFRMLEPVDWDNDGEWEAVAGIDGLHPRIPNVWLYYWDSFEKVDDVLPKAEQWNGWKEKSAGTLFSSSVTKSVKAVAGQRIFADRDYVFNSLPEELQGLHFLPSVIESSVFKCSAAGVVYLLVPYLDGPNRNFFVEEAGQMGFRLTGIPDFVLFGESEKNRVAVMAADLPESKVLVFGKWAVALFK